MKKYTLLLFVSSIFLLQTCTKDQAGPDACFQEQVLPVFISNCTMSGCHNATDKRAGYDLTTYEGIMQGVKAKHPLTSEVYTVIRGKNPSMPARPYAKLSLRDVNMIKLWINKGARNTSNCISCDSTNFDYASRIQPIMNAWCVGCHNSSNAGGGYNLSDYSGVVAAIKAKRLMGSIRHTSGYLAMPQTGGQLSSCDISAIQKWIDAGYHEN
ncbi:hypothetical protein CNR22_18610 [Sphingobacteriaceae bacterium]|nr:hypothetical protein CNR22_18610 [Sphingobacteriaceae bacterium]